MPLEQSVRRPGVDLTAAEWIVLGDGQRWAIPRPTPIFRPIFRAPMADGGVR